VVQVQTGVARESDLAARWPEYVEAPATRAHLPVPALARLPCLGRVDTPIFMSFTGVLPVFFFGTAHGLYSSFGALAYEVLT